MAVATARRTRKTQDQGQEQAQQPATEEGRQVDMATGEMTAAVQAPAMTVEAVPVTYYRPSVTMPDGQVIVCAHKYLHESEKAAAACGRRIAANGSFVK